MRGFLRWFWDKRRLEEKKKRGQWCNRNNESHYEGGSWSRCSVGCNSDPLWEKDWCFSSFLPAAPFLLLPSSPMSTVNLTWTRSSLFRNSFYIKLYVQSALSHYYFKSCVQILYSCNMRTTSKWMDFIFLLSGTGGGPYRDLCWCSWRCRVLCGCPGL